MSEGTLYTLETTVTLLSGCSPARPSAVSFLPLPCLAQFISDDRPWPTRFEALVQEHCENWRGSSCGCEMLSIVRGLLGTGPPDPTLESASPPPPLRGRFVRKTREGWNCRFQKTPRTEGGDKVPAVWTQGFRQVCLSRCPKS